MAQLYLKGVYYDTESEGLWYLDNAGAYQEISTGGGSSYLVYAIQFLQDDQLALTVTELANGIGAGAWVKSGTGLYVCETTTDYNAAKVYCAPFSNWYDAGTPGIPLVGGSNTTDGNYWIVVDESSVTPGKTRIRMIVKDAAGSAIDLYSIVGATTIYVPEVRIYP